MKKSLVLSLKLRSTQLLSATLIAATLTSISPRQAHAEIFTAISIAAKVYEMYSDNQKTQNEYTKFNQIQAEIENARNSILGALDRRDLDSATGALTTGQNFTATPSGNPYVFDRTYTSFLNMVNMAISNSTDYEVRKTALTLAMMLGPYPLISLARDSQYAPRFKKVAGDIIGALKKTLEVNGGPRNCGAEGIFGIAVLQVLNPYVQGRDTDNCHEEPIGDGQTQRVCDMALFCHSRTFNRETPVELFEQELRVSAPSMPGYMDVQRTIWNIQGLSDGVH